MNPPSAWLLASEARGARGARGASLGLLLPNAKTPPWRDYDAAFNLVALGCSDRVSSSLVGPRLISVGSAATSHRRLCRYFCLCLRLFFAHARKDLPDIELLAAFYSWPRPLFAQARPKISPSRLTRINPCALQPSPPPFALNATIDDTM
jgi:hypothetical protein